MIASVLLRNGSLHSFEAFVDPQLNFLSESDRIKGSLYFNYPASIVPIGLHSLMSLHILQLGNFRDCACYGDIIHASPNLSSLWVDVSPTFNNMLKSIDAQLADILPILLRQPMCNYSNSRPLVDNAKLK